MNLSKKNFHSPILCEDLNACCERSKVPPTLMIRAVAMRWNTMAELIGHALKLRESLTSCEPQTTQQKHTSGNQLRDDTVFDDEDHHLLFYTDIFYQTLCTFI
jgi:hypothetical protein